MSIIKKEREKRESTKKRYTGGPLAGDLLTHPPHFTSLDGCQISNSSKYIYSASYIVNIFGELNDC